MDLHSHFSRIMMQGLIGGLFLGIGILQISDFLLYEIDIGFLWFGLFMFSVGVLLCVYWNRQISGIVNEVEREFRESKEKLKIDSAAKRKSLRKAVLGLSERRVQND